MVDQHRFTNMNNKVGQLTNNTPTPSFFGTQLDRPQQMWSSYLSGANHRLQVAVPGGQSRGSGEQLVCYGLASSDGDQDYHDDEEDDGNDGTEYSVFVDNEANNNNNIMITTMKSWWNKYYYLLLFW